MANILDTVVEQFFQILKSHEKEIFNHAKFVMSKDRWKNIWEITTESEQGMNAFIIEQINDSFTLMYKSKIATRICFKNLSAEALLHGGLFYVVDYWAHTPTLPDYIEVSNDMTLEKATTSLQNNLKGLKYAYFNKSKGINLKQVNDKTYSYEVTINGKTSVVADTLEVIARATFLLSVRVHMFYIWFQAMKMDKAYEEECKQFFMYDNLLRFYSISFLRTKKGDYKEMTENDRNSILEDKKDTFSEKKLSIEVTEDGFTLINKSELCWEYNGKKNSIIREHIEMFFVDNNILHVVSNLKDEKETKIYGEYFDLNGRFIFSFDYYTKIISCYNKKFKVDGCEVAHFDFENHRFYCIIGKYFEWNTPSRLEVYDSQGKQLKRIYPPSHYRFYSFWCGSTKDVVLFADDDAKEEFGRREFRFGFDFDTGQLTKIGLSY